MELLIKIFFTKKYLFLIEMIIKNVYNRNLLIN